MSRYSKVLTLLLLAGALCLSTPGVGRADTILSYQLDGGSITTLMQGPSLSSTLSFTGFIGPDILVVFDTTSETNGPTVSQIFSATTSVMNLGAASLTLRLWASSQDFTMPSQTDLRNFSGAGGTYFGPTNAAVTFQAYADAGNGLLGLGHTNGLQVASPASGSTGTWDTGEASSTFTRGPGNYSMTIVTNLTLDGGAGVNYTSHQIVATPEPATLALLGLGLIGLAAGKRRQANQRVS